MSRSLYFIAAVIAAILVSTIAVSAASLHRMMQSSKSEQHETFDLFFHLRRVHPEQEIEDAFNARSTPGNALFRKFLNVDQLTELVQSSSVIINKVDNFLKTEAGCSSVKLLTTKDALVCKLKRSNKDSLKLHSLISAEFDAAKNDQLPRIDVTDLAPLASVQKFVRGVVAYRGIDEKIAEKKPQQKNLKQPGMDQTPNTINERYKVPNPVTGLESGVYTAVAEFEGSYYEQSDLDAFTTRYGLPTMNLKVMGPAHTPGGAGAVEATLDLEYVASHNASGASLGVYWLGQKAISGEPGNIDFHDLMEKVMKLAESPVVISISWGYGFQRMALYGDKVINLDNDAFRKIGLTGVSVFVASGDSGVGVRSEVFQCDKFTPSWPAASPYVTTVSATYANSQGEAETVVDWAGSGFNTVNARPSWQEEAVEHYLSTAPNLPKASFYNRSGRAYPDVTALGTNFQIHVNGNWMPVSGTSAASPTFAGIVGLVVAARKKAGKGPLGFLNPALYRLGKVGQDITNGHNQDANCIPMIPIRGFTCTPGWDAVTGLGSPSYEYLREHLMQD